MERPRRMQVEQAARIAIDRRANDVLPDVFERLFRAYGPQHWWPAKTATEVVIGAILTQNTSWKNVERAVARLRAARCLTWRALHARSRREIESLIRPAGTFRVKAARLTNFTRIVCEEFGGSLKRMLAGESESVRRRLLEIPGIGPETADAILLYAGNRPTFVADAYSRRILRRHFLISASSDYEATRRMIHSALPAEPNMFNEFHALLVHLGKLHCRTRARCEGCPLEVLPHDRDR